MSWRSRADRNVRSAPGRLTGDSWLGSGPKTELAVVTDACNESHAGNTAPLHLDHMVMGVLWLVQFNKHSDDIAHLR